MSIVHKLDNSTYLRILMKSAILIDSLLTKHVLVGERVSMCEIDRLLAILRQFLHWHGFLLHSQLALIGKAPILKQIANRVRYNLHLSCTSFPNFMHNLELHFYMFVPRTQLSNYKIELN